MKVFLILIRCAVRAFLFSLDFVSQNWYIINRGNEMAVRVKPVQPTEIKDKKIAREVIEQIRKPIPASVYRRNRELADLIDKMTIK
jgi:hypothetical protein